ncbi:MAG: hypothetical protein CFE34_15375 [Rhodobacteraceae bacterium PARR1]|nr:MAG: hypothetical protein CFE34_15375 [Rhodobacteraceae bacterium PARR1]
MRALTSIFLALLLAVTSVTFASARVQAVGITQMVICTQGAARLVTLDAAGNPVEMPHHCPDCLAAFPPLPSLVAMLARLDRPVTVALLPGRAQTASKAATDTALARGPPIFV